MLERAKGCLEHNGRQLLRLRSKTGQTQRLHYGFWSHGAGDIELSGWWADLLARSTQEEKEKAESAMDTARRYVKAGFSRGHFLDFLYPAKTQKFMRSLDMRGQRSAARHFTSTSPHDARIHDRRRQARRSSLNEKDASAETNADEVSPEIEEHLRELQRDQDHMGGVIHHEDADTSNNEHYEQSDDSDYETIYHAPKEREVTARKGAQKRPKLSMRQRRRLGLIPRVRNVQENMAAPWTKYYNMRRHWYERRQRTSKLIRRRELFPLFAKSWFSRYHLINATVGVYSRGKKLVRRLENNILNQLINEKPDMGDWTDKNWTVFFKIFKTRNNFMDPIFLKGFDKALELGLATRMMPGLVMHLLDPAVSRGAGKNRFRNALELYVRYTSFAARVPQSLPKFWDYAQIKRARQATLTNLRMFFKGFSIQHAPSRGHPSGLTSESMANNLLPLARVIITHPCFATLSAHTILNFYASVEKVVNRGPASYESMKTMLITVIFHGPELRNNKSIKHTYTALHAYKLYCSMQVRGGYQGESIKEAPDLGRKLLFMLTRLNLTPYALEIFKDLQRRYKAKYGDYEVIQVQMAKRGLDSALKELEVDRKDAEARWTARNPRMAALDAAPALKHYKTLLETHRVRGEPRKMLSVFEDMCKDPNAKPDNYTYNLMISGFSNRQDLGTASDFFARILEAGLSPDAHSYEPIIRAHARRGDIESVRALAAEMESTGIAISGRIISSHVYAYIQRGLLGRAEQLVEKSLKFELEDRTKMWNYVILAWAIRGHRRKVNSLMLRMKKKGVPFDEFTYSCRMQMWITRGRHRPAWGILRTTMPKLGLRPLPYHFALMILGFAQDRSRARSRQRVQKALKYMLKIGLQPDWNVMVAMARTLATNRRIVTPDAALRHYQKLMTDMPTDTVTLGGPAIMSMNIDDQKELYTAGIFDFMFRLAKKKHFLPKFDEIWDTYRSHVGKQSSDKAEDDKHLIPPVNTLLKLMAVHRKRGDFGMVRKCWKFILEKVERLGRLPDGSILPARRAILCRPLHSYMTSLYVSGASIDTIKGTIADVLDRGLELDNRCWNMYIRLLCIGGPEHHFLAFETAEEQVFHGPMHSAFRKNLHPNPQTRALQMRDRFDKRLTFSSSYRKTSVPHYPFRLKSSIGEGYSQEYKRAFRRQQWRFGMERLRLKKRNPGLKPVDEIPVDGEALKRRRVIDLEPSELETLQQIAAPEQEAEAESEPDPKPEPEADRKGPAPLDELTPGNVAKHAFSADNIDDHESLDRLGNEKGMMRVPAFRLEGSLVRRPEYSTIVYLTRVYLDLANLLAIDPKGERLLKELGMKARNTIKMIKDLPKTRDSLQRQVLYRRKW